MDLFVGRAAQRVSHVASHFGVAESNGGETLPARKDVERAEQLAGVDRARVVEIEVLENRVEQLVLVRRKLRSAIPIQFRIQPPMSQLHLDPRFAFRLSPLFQIRSHKKQKKKAKKKQRMGASALLQTQKQAHTQRQHAEAERAYNGTRDRIELRFVELAAGRARRRLEALEEVGERLDFDCRHCGGLRNKHSTALERRQQCAYTAFWS